MPRKRVLIEMTEKEYDTFRGWLSYAESEVNEHYKDAGFTLNEINIVERAIRKFRNNAYRI